MGENQQLPHRVTMEERRRLTVTGATEVLSFDEDTVILRIGQDTLAVQGENLQLKQLNPEGGNVAVEGQIGSLTYEQSKSSGSWLSRLFG